ncbi:hypothetical protein BDV98DRAFT_604248 [Pterulicium gracile]|uniref:SAP domain-containing protein n=1 Tax=Pterulicium gracile TaxID=1884261 RepID=A0A5C3QIG6_9AGAR|nr:hypothetical protein BDV98DRAFT_604248 [Pterula gracilis]
MESRLKALKVADLKVYLQKAGLDTNGKKQDLVNRILENKSARDIFEPPTDATPEDQPAAAPAPVPATSTPVSPAPAADPPRTPASAATQATPASVKAENAAAGSASPAAAPAVTETGDEDLEKRRKRAERFGIPLVEKSATNGSSNPTATDERKKARAERFGIPAVAGVKREQNGEVNAEEEERRRKRAERFSTKKEDE